MKILVSRSGGLGDCILTLPVFKAIKDMFPNSEIDILGNGTMAEVAGLTDIFGRSFSFDTGKFSSIFNEGIPDPEIISFFSQYDIIYFFSSHNKASLGDKFRTAGVKNYFILDPREPEKLKQHYSEYLYEILEKNETTGTLLFPEINIPEAPAKRNNRILIHPGSGSKRKNWPFEKFAALSEKLIPPVTFILGPAEIENSYYDKISGIQEIVTPASIKELFSLLSEGIFYIGCDSGVSHCAALSGVRSVVLFGPTNPEVWKPLGSQTEILQAPYCNLSNITVEQCMEKIPSDFLLEK